MTYSVQLSVHHYTENNQFWLAEGHGVSAIRPSPESLWALKAMEAGLDPLGPVEFVAPTGTVGMRWASLQCCALRAARARNRFEKRLLGK